MSAKKLRAPTTTPRLVRDHRGEYCAIYYEKGEGFIKRLDTWDRRNAEVQLAILENGVCYEDKPVDDIDHWRRHIKALVKWTKSRAIRNGLSFSLTEDRVLSVLAEQRYACIISGIYLTPYTGTRQKRNPFAPSIDRIDTEDGYTPDNTRLVCSLVNIAMNTWGLEPLSKAAFGIARKEIVRGFVPYR